MDGSCLVLFLLFPHVCGAELGLGLGLEGWLLYLDAYCAHNSLAAVLGGVVFLEEFLESLCYSLAVGCEVGASVAGVLAIDEGGYILAVGVAVGENNLYVFAFQMDRGVEGLLGKVLVHQVKESVGRLVQIAVEVQGKAFLQVGVVLYH